jgi:hypothetical protein
MVQFTRSRVPAEESGSNKLRVLSQLSEPFTN